MPKLVFLIVAILIALVLALAIWSDILKVRVLIGIGSADVQIVHYSAEEFGEDGKDWVASCLVSIDSLKDEDVGNPSGDNDLDLNITIVNGYPGYGCRVIFKVKNTGTVPLVGPFYELPELTKEIKLLFNATPSQLDPDVEEGYSIYIEVLQSANQNEKYEIQLHLKYVQWNEWGSESPEIPPHLTALAEFR